MVDASIAIQEILKHYFQLGLKTDEAADKIQELEGNEGLFHHTA